MNPILQFGDEGVAVETLQQLLVAAGYSLTIDGDFGSKTQAAVMAFQQNHFDPRGRRLSADGVVGALTWWALRNPARPDSVHEFFDTHSMSAPGGSPLGRKALEFAIAEIMAGASEIGGNNKGPFVEKYHRNNPALLGAEWCASFVSFCFEQAADTLGEPMPFNYTAGARDVRAQFRAKGWGYRAGEALPMPGDVVVWWRGERNGFQGHVGLVHHYAHGILYTIEGNKTKRVQGFDYVLSRETKLLGLGRVGGI
jgi:hypothetical protein